MNESLSYKAMVGRKNSDLLRLESSALGASVELTAMEMARSADKMLGEESVTPEEALQLFEDLGGCRDDVMLFAKFCEHLQSKADEEPLPSPERVSYVRNPYSDRVFDVLSGIYGSLRVFYAENSKGVCESVYYDETDSCILPFESGDEGLLLSFRRLMLKYELRVISVVKLQTGDDSYTGFALLTNASCDPLGNYCELYLPSADGTDTLSVCSVLEALSVFPERITSVPAKEQTGYDLHICIKGEPQDIKNAVFCLESLYKTCISLGQYKIYNLKRNIYER